MAAYPFTTKDWRDFPTTTTPLDAAAIEDLETRVTAYTDSNIEQTTTLPTAGNRFLGRQVMYKGFGSAADPSWHAVWDTALNGGSGAWACAGGVSVARVDTSQGTTSAAFTDLATVGPSITIPAAGVYEIYLSAWMLHGTANGQCVAGLSGAGLTAADADAIMHQAYTGSAQGRDFALAVKTLTTGTLKMVYKSPLGGTATFLYRQLAVRAIELT